VNHPDWYPDWRHEVVHELHAKNERPDQVYSIKRWPRWDYDPEAGTLTFSENGIAKVVAEIQVVGTTSAEAANWLWAWANAHWPEHCIADSLAAREFGQEHGICDLTHDYLSEDRDLNGLGWELTAVVARICGSVGAYRPPRDEGGGLYLVYRKVDWVT
jgi:hypothetical protein